MSKSVKVGLAVVVALLVSSSAWASALTLENPGLSIYQQTTNRPCVIGDSSCNNPVGFDYTLIPTGPSGETYDLTSPTYTVGQITTLLSSNQFWMGVDVNSTTKPLATEYLVFFKMFVNGVEVATYTGPTNLYTVNNGNGYSDELLKGFDLTGYNSALSVVFEASVRGATDGREEFFLIKANDTQPCTENCSSIPEPATLALLGTGLAVTALRLRRRAK